MKWVRQLVLGFPLHIDLLSPVWRGFGLAMCRLNYKGPDGGSTEDSLIRAPRPPPNAFEKMARNELSHERAHISID